MRDTDLPSPGLLSNGFLLRRTAAIAISAIQIQAGKTAGGKTPAAAKLQAFFTGCATTLNALVDVIAQTVSTRVRTAANTATVTFTGALMPSTSVPTSAFAVVSSGAVVRPVTKVVVTGSTIVVTATGAIATDTITYTAPATLYAEDQEGNKLASFTGVLA
jgi:hypothetical protein